MHRQSWRDEATKNSGLFPHEKKTLMWSKCLKAYPLREAKRKYRQRLQLVACGGDVDTHQANRIQFKRSSSTYSFPCLQGAWHLSGTQCCKSTVMFHLHRSPCLSLKPRDSNSTQFGIRQVISGRRHALEPSVLRVGSRFVYSLSEEVRRT